MEAEGHLGRLFIPLFDKHLLNTNHVPGTFVDTGDRDAQAGRVPWLPRNYIRQTNVDKLNYIRGKRQTKI